MLTCVMPLMNKLFTMMSQTCLKSEKSNFKSFFILYVHSNLWSISLSLSPLSLSLNTEGGVLSVSCQTQAGSTISQVMIFNNKNEFGSQKQDTQRDKLVTIQNQKDTRSSLPWHEISLLLHSTSCIHSTFEKSKDTN